MFSKITTIFFALLLSSSISFAGVDSKEIKEGLSPNFFQAISLNMPELPPAPSLRKTQDLPPSPTGAAFKKSQKRTALGDLKRQSVWLQLNQPPAPQVAEEPEYEEYDSGSICINTEAVDNRLNEVKINFDQAEIKIKEQVIAVVSKLKSGESLTKMETALLNSTAFQNDVNNEVCGIGKKDRPSHKQKRRIFSIFEPIQLKTSFPTKEADPSSVKKLIKFWESPKTERIY